MSLGELVAERLRSTLWTWTG